MKYRTWIGIIYLTVIPLFLLAAIFYFGIEAGSDLRQAVAAGYAAGILLIAVWAQS